MTSRASDQLRAISITPDYTDAPAASVLICCGRTRVLCTASVEERVPPFRLSSGGGWMTAEYSMLPGATERRSQRASSRGQTDGRSTEIQRLIGRSLRSAFNIDKLGQRTLWIDCDVLQADGGTRTAAITGGYVAARLAVERLANAGKCTRKAAIGEVTAISVGVVDGKSYLDLDYKLDSTAEVDMNVVMDGKGGIVELQGTGERANFTRKQLDGLLDLAEQGIAELQVLQRMAIEDGLRSRPKA